MSGRAPRHNNLTPSVDNALQFLEIATVLTMKDVIGLRIMRSLAIRLA